MEKSLQWVKDLSWEISVTIGATIVCALAILLWRKRGWVKAFFSRMMGSDIKALAEQVAALKSDVSALRQRVDTPAPDAAGRFNEKLEAAQNKFNDKLEETQKKFNEQLGLVKVSIDSAIREIEIVKTNLGEIESDSKKTGLPEPIMSCVTYGVLWLQFKEGALYQPYCETCANKGARVPITPRKQDNNFLMKCSQCGFWTRFKIEQFYLYQNGNHHDVSDEPGKAEMDFDPFRDRP